MAGQLKITIGSKIKVSINGEIKNFEIVDSGAVDTKNNKISYSSPVGEALLGKEMGNTFEFKLPSQVVVRGKVIEVSDN